MRGKYLPRLVERPPDVIRRLRPEAIFRMPYADEEREVYLTFDDGPIPEMTPWLLDILDHYEIKATFFVVADNVRKYPHLYREIRERGHRVGNHTMHHLNGIRVRTDRYLADISEAAQYVESDLFRPPHGWLTPRQYREVGRRYRIVMFDLVTRDYDPQVDARQVLENVRQMARPGSIIVFHDSLKSCEKLREALPQSIEWLISEGYTFRTID